MTDSDEKDSGEKYSDKKRSDKNYSDEKITVPLEVALKAEALMREDVFRTPRNLPISDYALHKAKAYAKVVCLLSGEGKTWAPHWEAYGYQVREAWSLDGVVDDICFARNQNPQSAYVQVEAQGVKDTAEEMQELGYTISGWWHSHGDLPVFHSSTDNQNHITIAHETAPKNMFAIQRVNPVIEHGFLYVGDYRIGPIQNSNQLEVLTKRQRNPVCFSLVVNRHGQEFVRRLEKDLETGDFLRPQVVKTNVIPDDRTYSIADIEDDIRRKLHLRPREPEKRFMFYDTFVDRIVKETLNYVREHPDARLVEVLSRIGRVPVNEVFASNPASNPDSRQQYELDPQTLEKRMVEALVLSPHEEGHTWDCHDMHALLLTRFLSSGDPASAGRYTHQASLINEAHGVAKDLTRSLCRYAMLPLQNAKSNLEDAARLNYFLSTLNTHERRAIAPDFSGQSREHFLYFDRSRVYQQFLGACVDQALSGVQNPLLASLVSFSKDIESGQATLKELYHDTIRQARAH